MSEFEQYNAGTHPIVKLTDDWNNLLDHGLVKEPDAVIYLSGGLAVAVSGSTGKVITSDADLSVVVTACFTAGALWVHIKAGAYTTWATVVSNIPAYGRLTGSAMDLVTITASAVMADGMVKLLNSGCRVEDLTLDCDGKFNYGVIVQGATCECIEVQVKEAAITGFIFNGANKTGSKLKWCKSKDNAVIGCDILNTNTDIWILGCTFSVANYSINNSVGLRINASGVQVTDPHIWGCDDGVVLADVSSIENLTLKGGYIESNVRHNMKWGTHSVRACYVEAVFWTNAATNTIRTTRVAELGGEVFCDIYTDTPNPNPSAYRQERNVVNCIFNGNSYQSYAIYRNTYYFQYNNISGSKFRTSYLVSELGETTGAVANWNIVADPDLEPEIATVQTTHYWSDPVSPPFIGRHEGKLLFMYNSHLEEYRLGAYINGDWRHANLTDMPTGVTNVPIGGIIMWSGLKSSIPDGWGLCLTGDSLIILKDGSTRTIKDVVESRETVDVLSYDATSKRFVYNKVTNWFKNKAERQEWLRLKISKGKGLGYRSLNITLNHPVLTARGWVEAGKLNNDDVIYRYEDTLTVEGKQAIIGMFLGDASIEETGRIDITHGMPQHEYIYHIAESLNSSVSESVASTGYGKGKTSLKTHISLKTLCPELVKLLHKEQKVTPELLNQLGDIGLAYWYMDDGSLSKDTRYPEYFRANLHTEGFSKEEVAIIIEYFKGIGINSKAYPRNNTRGETLCIDRDNNEQFFSRIAPYIHPSLLYKIPEKYRILYQPFKWITKGAVEFNVMSRRVMNYSTSKRYDKNYDYKYNIEVENTNTYIANGFIVHNCDGDDASLVVDTGVTTGNFTVFGINVGTTSTLTNGTGTATGSVITLLEGINTITVTAAGTFTIALRDGATAKVVSGTATIVSSPVRTFKTPDLRGLFAKSITAGEPGATGGSTTYTHSGTSATTTPNLQGAGAGNVVTAVDVSIDNHTGVEPPYYTLAYIMRIR